MNLPLPSRPPLAHAGRGTAAADSDEGNSPATRRRALDPSPSTNPDLQVHFSPESRPTGPLSLRKRRTHEPSPADFASAAPLRRLERHILQQLRDPGRIFCRASKKSWPEHELVQRSHGDGVRPAARSAALEVGGNAATGRADGAAPAVEALHHPGAWRLARWQIKMAFSVVCDSTNMGEDVGVIGECEELGIWKKAVRMSAEQVRSLLHVTRAIDRWLSALLGM